MDDEKRIITRRDFIRAGSCFAMGSIMGLPLLAYGELHKPEKSRVVLVRNKDVLDDQGNARPDVLSAMLDQAMTALLGVPQPVAAWKSIFGPNDVVGVKTNSWNALPTPGALENAIRNRLIDAGVKSEHIAVDDRGVRRNPVFQQSTALVNVRPMRAHHWAGLGTLLKNYIMFVPEPWKYHDNACETLGAIWKLPHVAGKTRLNVLVMLTPLFHGVGPHNFSSRYTWPYSGLIVSTDPVAADATGARIIQAKRNIFFGTQKPISPPPHHIQAADVRYGLGNSGSDRITIVKLGWEEDILV